MVPQKLSSGAAIKRHDPETGFEEMRTQASFDESSLPPSGLLDRMPNGTCCESSSLAVFPCRDDA